MSALISPRTLPPSDTGRARKMGDGDGPTEGHWLDRYATAYHRWRLITVDSQHRVFARPLGLVETSFNHDGSDLEGRADVNMTPTCEVETSLSANQVRSHILAAWAALRANHALLRARVQDARTSAALTKAGLRDKCFVLDVPESEDTLLNEAWRTIVFVEQHYLEIDPALFLRHAMNTARCIDASKELARLFILPIQRKGPNRFVLNMLLVCAHQILDGATVFAWTSDLIRLLNTDDLALHAASAQPDTSEMWKTLPPAQEDLYPKIQGSKAQQRWFWVISRILRHCQRPHPPAFSNPLRRNEPWPFAKAEDPLFDKVLNYEIVPPLNSYVSRFELPPSVTQTMHRLCRQANVSIGAGGFALVALAMMELYEERYPDIPLAERKGFISTFPVNPRPFLNYNAPPDSLMLAFSNGIYFPFLPRHLPIAGRFKLLVKCAHRQLRIFQKRTRDLETKAQIGSRSAMQMIPALYTTFIERTESFKTNLSPRLNPQGAYTVDLRKSGATCGVSSVGAVGDLLHGDANSPNLGADFRVVDLISAGANVRVRDDEFLCGIVSEQNRTSISTAFDGNAIEEDRVVRWVEKMQRLLDPELLSRL